MLVRKKFNRLLFVAFTLSIFLFVNGCATAPTGTPSLTLPTLTASILPTSFPTQTATEAPTRAEALALTPPMGWNSFNHFGCAITESLVRQTADAMVSSGMQSAG